MNSAANVKNLIACLLVVARARISGERVTGRGNPAGASEQRATAQCPYHHKDDRGCGRALGVCWGRAGPVDSCRCQLQGNGKIEHTRI